MIRIQCFAKLIPAVIAEVRDRGALEIHVIGSESFLKANAIFNQTHLSKETETTTTTAARSDQDVV